jgi:hypothetical protein
MSRLYLSEEGRVLSTLGEELTAFRRARKQLELPGTDEPGILYVLARSHGDVVRPLHLAVNGTEVAPIEPDATGVYCWREIEVEASLLREGMNSFEFWAETSAMNAWALAVEGGHVQPRSSLSDDSGKSWRSERMGYLNLLRGEYVVRMRLAEGEDPEPAAVVPEDPACPRLESLRQATPLEARQPGPLLTRVRTLSSWLASSWEHTSSARATQNTPWDAETILAWGSSQCGHSGQRPIAMCVHYGVALVSFCQALGIPARCAVLMGTPNGFDGHFVAEVWFEEYGKWVMVDPNADAICWKDGKPLSIPEIQQAGDDLRGVIEWGPGSNFQRTFPHMVEFIQENLEKGVCFRHRSVWHRADLISHPELSPPGHGSVSYCETGLVWEKRDLGNFGMFPLFAEPEYFDAPPVQI